MKSRLTITEVAEKVGVSPKTLIRWEKTGKIQKPKRDWKGWRVYEDLEAEAIERMVNQVYEV